MPKTDTAYTHQKKLIGRGQYIRDDYTKATKGSGAHIDLMSTQKIKTGLSNLGHFKRSKGMVSMDS